MKRIGEEAFYSIGSHSSSLELIFEKDSRCTLIKKRAFQRSGIDNFTLPEQLETIGVWAFGLSGSPDRRKMSSFTIPENVKNIGYFAFADNFLIIM